MTGYLTKWGVVELGSCLNRIDAGSSPDLPDRPARPGEWGVLKVSAVRSTGFDASENKAVTNNAFIDPQVEVRDGDLLITRANTPQLVGLACYVASPPGRLLLCDKTLRLVVDERKLIGKFAGYALAMPSVRKQIEVSGTGSSGTMKNISQVDIRSLRIPLPPVGEQRRIVDILDSIDEALDASRRTAEKVESSRRATINSLLMTRRAGLPRGWRRISIGDFAEVRRGASPRPIDDPAWFSDDGPGWVRIRDVTASRKYLRSTTQRLSPAGVARSVPVHPGQVIMSIAATVGEVIIVDMEACIHDGFVVVVPDSKTMLPEYLAALLKSHRGDFVGLGQTGTQVNINGDIVKRFTVAVPPVSEQVKIVDIINLWEGRSELAENEVRKLEQVKNGLAGDLLDDLPRTV